MSYMYTYNARCVKVKPVMNLYALISYNKRSRLKGFGKFCPKSELV